MHAHSSRSYFTVSRSPPAGAQLAARSKPMLRHGNRAAKLRSYKVTTSLFAEMSIELIAF
jgi:hypothetical protein